MRFAKFFKGFCVVGCLWVSGWGATAQGQLLLPTNVTWSTPSGSNNPASGAKVDDVLLASMTFDGTTFTAGSGQFVAGVSVYVNSGRSDVNAEWGDNDTDSDGNPNPFVRVGLNPADQESTDPAIQDKGLASAFFTNSLVEGTDGESGSYAFSLIFEQGITDNDAGSDSLPEVVLFERGNNDDSTIRAIVGGTYDAPVFAPIALTINSGELFNTGLVIDTTEITSSQELAAGGFDLSDFFGASPQQTVWGIQIESNGGDFYGQFLSAEDPAAQFDPNVPSGLLNPLATVPEPSAALLVLLAAGSSILLRSRRRV